MIVGFYGLVDPLDSPSELSEGIHAVEGVCSGEVDSVGRASGIGSGIGGCSTAGVGGGETATGFGFGGIFFFGLDFFLAVRFAFFFALFLAFLLRFLAKQ